MRMISTKHCLAIAVMMVMGLAGHAQQSGQSPATEPDMRYAPLIYDNEARQEAPAAQPSGLYSLDAGNAFYLLGDRGVSGRTYVLGNGSSRSLRNYIDTICEACADIQSTPIIKPGYGEIPYSEKQVMHLEADISELTRDTGFKPAFGFNEGIRETIEWYIGTHADIKKD